MATASGGPREAAKLKARFLDDAILQLKLLLQRSRKFDAVSNTKELLKAQRALVRQGYPAEYSARSLRLDEDDVKASLRTIQHWIICFASDSGAASMICEKLVEVALQLGYEQHETTHSRFSRNKDKPSSKDEEATVDDLVDDDSLEFFLLETLYICMKESFAKGHRIEVSQGVSRFCFGFLHFKYSNPIRNKAAQCLGEISISNIQDIIPLFENMMLRLKGSSKSREFVPYQHAVGFLTFGVESSVRCDMTLLYFELVAAIMPKTDRGVLRREISASLVSVLGRLVPMDGASSVESSSWVRFCNSAPGKRLMVSWELMYNATLKWAKKSKHATFSFTLLCTLLTRAPSSFSEERTVPLLTFITSGSSFNEFVCYFRVPLWSSYVQKLMQPIVDTPLPCSSKEREGQ